MKDINFKQTEDTLFLEEEHIILREQVKKFVETEVKPVAQNWESNGFIPRGSFQKNGCSRFSRDNISNRIRVVLRWMFAAAWFLQRNSESLHFLALQLPL